MPRPASFSETAMATALEDTPISYEDLAAIEKDFEDAEVEISMLLLQKPHALQLYSQY